MPSSPRDKNTALQKGEALLQPFDGPSLPGAQRQAPLGPNECPEVPKKLASKLASKLDCELERTACINAKSRSIVEGAREVFLADGFDGASVNDIARAAGVSKGTLYAYFPSKAALFAAVVRENMRVQAERLALYDDDEGAVEDVLRQLAGVVMDFMLDEASIAQIRTVIAAAPKFPEIGSAFFEAGPQFGRRHLASWLMRRVGAGQMTIDDPDAAATQFFDMLQGFLYKEMLFCCAPKPAAAAIEKNIDRAVRTFMAAYGPR